MECQVHYNFYDKYKNDDFDSKFLKRIQNLNSRYGIKESSIELIVKDYFVEIFSWSVIPFEILDMLNGIIKDNNITGIIDPCCGNAFHSYLFGSVLGLKTHTVDIQDEPNSWMDIKEIDGRLFMKDLDISEHKSSALLLSWIDYESLTIELLELYKGNLVISLGNYDRLSPNYIRKLNESFKMIKRVVLKMPWGLTEKIEVYFRS